jgi:iron-sulfur cluster assembly protein
LNLSGTHRKMNGMIDITPRAVEQIKKMMSQQGQEGASLRVGVKPAGCSGLEYVMDFARYPEPGDEVQTVDGLQVLVDAASAATLNGIRLDWGEGLLGSGFKFSNPNASKTCGCGKSFSV